MSRKVVTKMLFKDVKINTLYVSKTTGRVHMKIVPILKDLVLYNSLLIGCPGHGVFDDTEVVELYRPEDFKLRLRDINLGVKFRFKPPYNQDNSIYSLVTAYEDGHASRRILNETSHKVSNDHKAFSDKEIELV